MILTKKKISSCRKSSKRFLEFKKKLGLDPNVVSCDEQDIISALQVAFEGEIILTHYWIENKRMKNKIFKHMPAISKNVYFDPLDDIVKKYNNTVHKTIKMKPVDVTHDSYAEYMKIQIKKILNLKMVTMLEFQNIKTFLLKDTLQIGQKKFLLLAELRMQFLGLMLLVT